jgi:hypothetical protein
VKYLEKAKKKRLKNKNKKDKTLSRVCSVPRLHLVVVPVSSTYYGTGHRNIGGVGAAVAKGLGI